MEIAGRQKEISIMQDLLEDRESSFMAIYGRRRVGKTYLIRQVYEKEIVFESSGLHQKTIKKQLEGFWTALNDVQKSPSPPPPAETWLQAFAQLKTYLNTLTGTGKKVVFLDEVAWFETSRSGFLAALDNFWNQYCTKRRDIILIICGSAASWIIAKVVNDRGGLHNRITKRILLKPFTLSETKDFLAMNRVNLPLKDLALLYMCVGGIPFYLKDMKAGDSVPVFLDRLFFDEQAILDNEFKNLYASLFKNNALHEAVIAALASKNKGLTRNEIIEATGLQTGGTLSLVLEELLQCGFIRQIFPISKSKEDHLYRLIDEYSLFYFKFLAGEKTNSSWSLLAKTPSFTRWAGYAFENLCFKHTAEIKKALGISGVITNEYSFNFKGNEDLNGAQIDLVIDRADNVINLLEARFYDSEFTVTEEYARQLRRKVHVFTTRTKTRKAVFITMLSVFGVQKNMHYLGIVTNQLRLDDLFV